MSDFDLPQMSLATDEQRAQMRDQALEIAGYYFRAFHLNPDGQRVLAILKWQTSRPARSFKVEDVIAHEAQRQLIVSIEQQIEFARTGGETRKAPWEQMQPPQQAENNRASRAEKPKARRNSKASKPKAQKA